MPASPLSSNSISSQPEAYTGTATTGKRPAPRGTAAYPRKRANKACQVCRSRRTKCDNKRPSCSFCEKVGTTCTWAADDLSSFDPASLAILDRFDRLESLLLSSPRPVQAETPDSGAHTWTNQSKSEEKHLGYVLSSSINVRLEAVLDWEPIQRRLISENVAIGGPRPAAITSAPAPAPPLSGEFDMGTCTNLLGRFWRNVHSKNPILNKDEVRRYMQQVCLDGIRWDAQSCLVLPTSDEEGSSEIADALLSRTCIAEAQQYFAAAQKRVGICLGKLDILEAQCFFYCGVYYVTMMQPEASWTMFLQALASCQNFQCLIRTDSEDDPFSEVEFESNSIAVAEECTYWTCLKSELEIHLDLNPPGFRTIDLWYPNRFPAPPRNTITESDRSWFFYLAEISLRRLANRIMSWISNTLDLENPMNITVACETAAGFEAEAQDWIESLPAPNNLNRYQDDVLTFILKGHLLNCYELIHWPFIKHAINTTTRDPTKDEHVKKGLQAAVDRIDSNGPGFKHRHHGTYGMIKSVTRSSFVLLAAHFHGGLGDLMPVGWYGQIETVDELLRFWEGELAGATRWRSMMKSLMHEVQIV